MYKELMVKGKQYNLRLTTKNSIQLEKALGCSVIEWFSKIDDTALPKLEDLMIVLHYMLQSLNHGMTMDKTYELYDDMIEDGYDMYDLFNIFIEVLSLAGYLPKKGEAAEDPKN